MTALRLNRPLHWYLEPTIVFLASLLAPLALLGHPPTFDELYHLLAARSWAADGTLEIAQGSYSRDAFFTVSIGMLFRTFGESLIVARLPSLLSGGLLVTGVFLWTREVVDRPSWSSAGTTSDRLLHHCHIVNFRGNSFRMCQHTEFWQALHGEPEPQEEPTT